MSDNSRRRYVVTRKYRVMGIEIGVPFPIHGTDNTITIDNWHGFKGFLPLLNWFSADEDFIQANQHVEGPSSADPLHAHVDWRFLTQEAFDGIALTLFRRPSAEVAERLGTHVILIDREWMRDLSPTFARLECRREYTLPRFEIASWGEALHAKYACAALANGKCPHRGVPVEAMIQTPQGLVCPAHGLRWKTTGELVPWRRAEH